jgi:hypothetical protein
MVINEGDAREVGSTVGAKAGVGSGGCGGGGGQSKRYDSRGQNG